MPRSSSGWRVWSASPSIARRAMLELVARFLVIGTLAFGGGQAALPLVERLAVADTGWLTPAQFATGVGLSYATRGPVLILASFKLANFLNKGSKVILYHGSSDPRISPFCTKWYYEQLASLHGGYG